MPEFESTFLLNSSAQNGQKGMIMRMCDLPMFGTPMFGLIYEDRLITLRSDDAGRIVIDGNIVTGLGDASLRIVLGATVTITIMGGIQVLIDGRRIMYNSHTISPSEQLHELTITRPSRCELKLHFFFGWDYPLELRHNFITSIPRAA